MEVSPHSLVATLTMSGEFRVHRAGCRDVLRDAQTLHPIALEARTPEGVALELHSDFIESGEMEPKDAEQYCEYLPCCDFKKAANNLEEVVDADAIAPYTEGVGQEGPAGTRGVSMNRTDANQALVEYTAEVQSTKTTDLRKLARQAGLKIVADTPVNKGRKADLVAALVELKGQELDAEVAEAKANKAQAPKPAKKSKAQAKRDAEQQERKAAKTSAQKSDDSALKIRTARKFVAEAEAKGWSVKVDNQQATEEGDIVLVTAEKGEEAITLRWIDGAYDYYQGGSFHTDAKGKARKILNVSAAINRYL